MVKMLRVGGTLILLSAVPFSFLFIPMLLVNITCGLVLLALGAILDSLNHMESKMLTSTISENHLMKMLDQAERYKVKSDDLRIDPEAAIYPVLWIDEQHYVPMRLFDHYTIPGVNEYIFTKTGEGEIHLKVHDRYEKHADLFELDGHLFVKLSALGLSVKMEGRSAWIRNIES